MASRYFMARGSSYPNTTRRALMWTLVIYSPNFHPLASKLGSIGGEFSMGTWWRKILQTVLVLTNFVFLYHWLYGTSVCFTGQKPISNEHVRVRLKRFFLWPELMRGLSNFHRLRRFFFKSLPIPPFHTYPDVARYGRKRLWSLSNWAKTFLAVSRVARSEGKGMPSGNWLNATAWVAGLGSETIEPRIWAHLPKTIFVWVHFEVLWQVGHSRKWILQHPFWEDDLKYPPAPFCSCISAIGIGSRCSPLHSISEVR